MHANLAAGSEHLLNPVERSAEVVFGLIMAVTVLGSLSIAHPGGKEVRTAMAAALGCNIAWGLVDAVMYLVRTLSERARIRNLATRVVSTDMHSAHRLIQHALPANFVAITGKRELEGMRRKLLARPLPVGTVLRRRDYIAGMGVFGLVVLATFPVVIPFMVTQDIEAAMRMSRTVTLLMLFFAGLTLGRYAGYWRPALTGVYMMLIGAALIAAVKALGG